MIGENDIAGKVIDTFELPQELLTSRKKSKNSLASDGLESGTPSASAGNTEIHSSNSVSRSDSRPHSDTSKPLHNPGASSLIIIDRQSHLEDHDGTPVTHNERELKTIQLPLGLDSVDGCKRGSEAILSSIISGCDREYNSTRIEDNKRSSSLSSDQELMSPCSDMDDFHSAEETPLDTCINNETTSVMSIKADGNGQITRIHVRQLIQKRYIFKSTGNILFFLQPSDYDQIKDLFGALMSRNIDKIYQCINGNTAVLNVTLPEVCMYV